MQQLTLWAPRPAKPAGPAPTYHKDRPCPGCGAKAGEYRPARRWRWLLGTSLLCEECGDDRAVFGDIRADYLQADRPPDPEACPAPPGSDAKIAAMARRVSAGLCPFQVWDNTWDPAPYRVPTGAPDHQHAPGDTGVEKCGTRWRARPFWRGRKWPLGIYWTEGEAIDRVRRFRDVYGPGDVAPPLLWLPTGDEDKAVAVDPEHLAEWKKRFAVGLKVRRVRAICRAYRGELRRLRVKPPTVAVWDELERRLERAAGPTLFDCIEHGEEPAIPGV